MKNFVPMKSTLPLRNFVCFFVIFLFFFNVSSSEDEVLLIERDVEIGESMGGIWRLTINTDSASAYRDSLLTNEVGTVYATDDIEVLSSVLMLQSFGRIKIKKPPRYLDFFVLNKMGELENAREYYHRKFDLSDARTMKVMEKLDADARDSLKVGTEALLYRYLGEGYHFIKLGNHFVELSQECFDFLSEPRYLWRKKVKTGRIEGWIEATRLTGYQVLDEN